MTDGDDHCLAYSPLILNMKVKKPERPKKIKDCYPSDAFTPSKNFVKRYIDQKNVDDLLVRCPFYL
jgi:hypothetical protein